MDDLRERLLRNAFLYDDPSAYAAGVEAALQATAVAPGARTGTAAEPVVTIEAHDALTGTLLKPRMLGRRLSLR